MIKLKFALRDANGKRITQHKLRARGQTSGWLTLPQGFCTGFRKKTKAQRKQDKVLDENGKAKSMTDFDFDMEMGTLTQQRLINKGIKLNTRK